MITDIIFFRIEKNTIILCIFIFIFSYSTVAYIYIGISYIIR